MDEIEHHTFSQGIFFKAPRKRSKAHAEKADKVGREELTTKYFEGFGLPAATVGIRYQCYRNHLEKIRNIMTVLRSKWFTTLVTNVFNYVKTAGSSKTDALEGLVIPVAFLVTGMPEDENQRLFLDLKKKLKEFSPHIGSVSSRTYVSCKTAFQLLCQQLMLGSGAEDLGSWSTDEDEVLDEDLSKVRRTREQFSANDLKQWHKNSNQSSARSPIIICLEDIDLFPLQVVQNLFMSFSCLDLPVIFVGGITSYCDSLDAYIPEKCPTTFVYKIFQTIPSEDRLSDVLTEVLNSRNFSMQLSGPVVRYLSDTYLGQDFSLSRFERIVQLCLLEHFRTPESVLCADLPLLEEKVLLPEVLTPEVVGGMFANETVKGAPRLKLKAPLASGEWEIAVFQSSPRKSVRQAGTGLRELEENVQDFKRRQLEWNAFIEFLFVILKDLPSLSSEFRILRNLYVSAWTGRMFKVLEDDDDKDSPIEKAIKILNMSARPQLIARLENGLKFLQHFSEVNEDLVESTNIPYFAEKMIRFLQKLANVDEEERKWREERGKEASLKKKFKSQTEFLESMKQMSQGCGKIYEKLQQSLAKDLMKESKTFLKPLHDHPVAKAYIFDDVDILIELVSPNSSRRIHAALSEPERFLSCEGCGRNEEDHVNSDVSIVYNLILEQTILNVNLNLIFESFKFQVESFSAEKETSPTKKRRSVARNLEMDQSLLVRFRHALSELQHMGFIRASKSKAHADEVMRLNFVSY